MKKFLIALILGLTIFTPSLAYAAAPSFSTRPGSGKVIVGKVFIVDILIDSENNSLNYARAVLKYDPTLVSISKAQRNESLFCTYPEDEQSIDNSSGLLMLTGFCQSGVGAPYKTSGEADVFARVTFKALKTGTVKLDWQHTGEDVPFKSVLMKDGSPPQNLLTTKPRQASFTIVKSVGTTPPPSTPNTPSTGFGLSLGLVGSGIILVLLGFGYVKWVERDRKTKLRTVVVYGDSSK
jgi:hypothetical protein